MVPALNIAIVGYGIAGITAAIRLRNLGHRVTHFERSNPPVAAGAGMLLHPPALRELGELGLLDQALECGAPVDRILAITSRNCTPAQVDYSGFFSGRQGLGIQRGVLHRLLSASDSGHAEVLAGQQITKVDAQRGLLWAASSHDYGPFDLIVVADGCHSLLRGQFTGLVNRNERAATAALVGLVDDPTELAATSLTQHFDGPRHLSIWPVGRASPGAPWRCSIAVNVMTAEADALLADAAWRSLVNRLCPAVGRMLEADREVSMRVFTWREVELHSHFTGRVALIGDAAHSMSPQLGVGAHLAMDDAATLARMLSSHADVPAALHAYSNDRKSRLAHYQRASRWLTPLFQSDSRMLSLLRDRLLERSQSGSLMRFARSLLGT